MVIKQELQVDNLAAKAGNHVTTKIEGTASKVTQRSLEF